MTDTASCHLDLLRRLGIDPTLGPDELLSQITVKWREMVRQEQEAKKADKSVVVDMGVESR